LHYRDAFLAFVEDFVDFVGLESGVHLLVFIRTIIRSFISQPKVVEFSAKKKIWDAVCEMKSMGGMGVIVYIIFIKVGLVTFKNLSLYGLAPKKNPLVPPHHAMACRLPLPIQRKNR
jgi:hypothetical protein